MGPNQRPTNKNTKTETYRLHNRKRKSLPTHFTIRLPLASAASVIILRFISIDECFSLASSTLTFFSPCGLRSGWPAPSLLALSCRMLNKSTCIFRYGDPTIRRKPKSNKSESERRVCERTLAEDVKRNERRKMSLITVFFRFHSAL